MPGQGSNLHPSAPEMPPIPLCHAQQALLFLFFPPSASLWLEHIFKSCGDLPCPALSPPDPPPSKAHWPMPTHSRINSSMVRRRKKSPTTTNIPITPASGNEKQDPALEWSTAGSTAMQESRATKSLEHLSQQRSHGSPRGRFSCWATSRGAGGGHEKGHS